MAVTDPAQGTPWWRRLSIAPDDPAQIARRDKHTQDALERHKREGQEMAVKARTIAMVVTSIMVLFLTPWPEVLFYNAILLLFILNGFLQLRVAKVGTSRLELTLLFADLALMTLVAVVPNPFTDGLAPHAFHFHFDIFKYYFILLATATLAYSWRTIFAVGTWTAGLWTIGVTWSWWTTNPDPELAAKLAELYEHDATLAIFLNPHLVQWDLRFQEVVVFILVSYTLGFAVRRSGDLVLAQAAVARERANLARYFSPNVVEQLSNNDDPLKQVAEQDIAVLFVDIVGFTRFSANRSPQEVIRTLREFHALMEREVFRYNGTLDKYLGDGLMATFGTPFARDSDAIDALRAARAMDRAVDEWNRTRIAAEQPEIKASFGLHAGPVVLGDIGANRLEFAVIGNTVNVASRLEALSRPLDARIVASDDLVRKAKSQSEGDATPFDGLERQPDQAIRGVDEPLAVWTLS